MSLAEETRDHPARRTIAPETDFYVVPLEQAPERIREITPRLLELMALAGGDCFVAGGCLRDAMLGQDPKDIDLYFSAWRTWTEAPERLVAVGSIVERDDCFRTVVRHPSIGLVDLLYSQGDEPLWKIRKFDFIACCAALHPNGFAFHRLWREQVHAGVLAFNACPNPAKTIKRLDRFQERGWTIRPDDLAVLLDVAINAPDGNEYF